MKREKSKTLGIKLTCRCGYLFFLNNYDLPNPFFKEKSSLHHNFQSNSTILKPFSPIDSWEQPLQSELAHQQIAMYTRVHNQFGQT
ncbi:unnamed protein product [Prunus brigantina]